MSYCWPCALGFPKLNQPKIQPWYSLIASFPLFSSLNLPTFLHLTVAGRKAITAKNPSNAPAPGPTENTWRTYSPVALLNCKSEETINRVVILNWCLSKVDTWSRVHLTFDWRRSSFWGEQLSHLFKEDPFLKPWQDKETSFWLPETFVARTFPSFAILEAFFHASIFVFDMAIYASATR